MYGIHHVHWSAGPPAPDHRHHRPPRRTLRHRLATLTVAVGGAAVTLGWRLVDAGQHARTGSSGGWLPRSAHPPSP